MKRTRILFLVLLLALALSACGASSGGGEPEEGGRPAEKNLDDADDAAPDIPVPAASGPEEADHVHVLSQGDNVLDHDPAGYCGNTVTTVSREPRLDGEAWKISFWGDDSVALTDLLLYLDYSGDVCRCMPEYRVDTEFGTGYGINLTEGYARCGDGQASLTAEQAEQIQAILDRQTAQGAN